MIWELGRDTATAKWTPMNIQQSTAPGRNLGQAGPAQAAGADSADVPRFASSKILGAAGEAMIEHDGHIYRLRRTSRGGLVLTK
jgi:hemin uptake protein HemP